MARLKLERHIAPGKVVARLGEERSVLVFHITAGRLVYGFDEPTPPAELEARLARTNEKKLAKMYGAIA